MENSIYQRRESPVAANCPLALADRGGNYGNPSVHARKDPLIMGVFPRRNAAETTKLFAPMAEYLGERLGRKVNLVTARDFRVVWQGVTEATFTIVVH